MTGSNLPNSIHTPNTHTPHNICTHTALETLTLDNMLAGICQLSITGVIETTSMVEAMHREIALRPFGLFNEKYSRLWRMGISGRVYSIIRGITALVGNSLNFGMTQYGQHMRHRQPQPLPNSMIAAVHILNGVLGDHLVTQGNPLALPMRFYDKNGHPFCHCTAQSKPKLKSKSKPKPKPIFERQQHNIRHSAQVGIPMPMTDQAWDQVIDQKRVIGQKTGSMSQLLTGPVVIILHGLCMSYLNWQPTSEEGLGQYILKSYADNNQPIPTLLYLDYNMGQRISTNGRQFSELLQSLITHNPDITIIDLVGHSMGGLISRSALHYGSEQHYEWVHHINKLIAIGTPHHGAALERIGDMVQQTINKLPFASALSKLGDIRSAGIIDLRHGSVRDEDWQSLTTRSVLPDDERYFTPLPHHIYAYFLAGTLTDADDDSAMGYLLGDGLVNIASALGEHTMDEYTLDVPDERKAILYEVSHLALLSDKRVHEQVVQWLTS